MRDQKMVDATSENKLTIYREKRDKHVLHDLPIEAWIILEEVLAETT